MQKGKINVSIFRKSVIVQRLEAKSQIEIEVQLKKEKVEEDVEDECNELVISLNIEEIENIYTIEEATYFDKVQAVFKEKWNAIPLGEEMMLHYIEFCKTRHFLPPRFFQLINGQLK